jgi:hypothetical protein
MIPRIPRLAVFAAVAIAVVLLSAGALKERDNLLAARADASSARAASVSALKDAAVAHDIARSYRDQAQLLDEQRRIAVNRAAASERHAEQLKGSFTTIAKTAPDTCRIVIAAADSALATQDSTITSLHAALQSAQEARSQVDAALDTTTAALTRLRAATTNLVHADAVISKASRPSFLARITPHPGVGAALGFDATGVPRVVIGFTLSWTL